MKRFIYILLFSAISVCGNAQAYFLVKDSCDVIDENEVSRRIASPIKVVGIEDGIVILGNPNGTEKTWKYLVCKDKPDIDSGSLTYWDVQNDGRAKCLKIDLDRGWIVFREWIAKDVTKETYFFTLDREATRKANQNK